MKKRCEMHRRTKTPGLCPICLMEENEALKSLCEQIHRFFENVGSVLTGDQIRKTWANCSTKAEIEEVLGLRGRP